MCYKKSIIVLLLSCFVLTTQSEVKFNYYTIQEKLSHNIVYAVEKDTTGLMWFATRNGVDSFDGKNFKHYDLITEQSPYSESNSARDLVTDHQGNLWVGSDKGLLKYNSDIDTFIPFPLKEGMVRGIVSMYLDPEGYLWVGSWQQIYLIDPSQGKILQVFDGYNYVRQIMEYDKDRLISICNNGCFLINRRDNSQIRILDQIFPKKSQGPNEISAVFKDKENNYWFASRGKGVFITDANFNIKRKIESVDYLSNNKSVVKKIFYFNESDIGILTDGEGLIILNGNYNIKAIYAHNDDYSSSLNTKALSDIYIDSANRIWITTIGGGINLHDPNLLSFHYIRHQINNVNSIKSNMGNTVLYNSNGDLWFGTPDGITIWNEAQNKWKHLLDPTDKKNNQKNRTIKALEKVSENEIWIGSHGGGIYIYDMNSGNINPIENIYSNSVSMHMEFISVLFKDSHGNVWISSLRNPLVRFDPRSGEFFTYPVTNVLSIFETKGGVIYFGSSSGLAIFQNNEVVWVNADSGIQFSSNIINCFLETNDGEILIGTEGGGINIYNPTKNSNSVISKADGLVSNIINCILPDNKGTYWASTSKGLSAFNLKNKKVVNYGLSDGLSVLSFIRGNGIRLNNGQLIFGGYDGYIKFDPNLIVQHEIPVKLKLLDLKISNISAIIGAEGSPLKKHIDQTDVIKLSYLQNSFTIDFTGINYTNPGQNQFSWKLEGFDKEWTPWTNNLSATYTNIEEGNYVFSLRTSTPYGLSDARSLKLVVRAPWWFSFWAYSFYFVVLSVSVFFVIHYFRIKFKERQSTEKIKFFTNIAHDIKTPLTLIHTPLQKLFDEKNLDDECKHSIEIAMRNAEKIKLIANQLLDFEKAGSKKMEINIEESNFVKHIKEISKSFTPLFEQKHIKFQLLTEIPLLEFYYDRKILEKIVNNLLSNAIKYTNAEGNISVKIKVQGKHCILKIADDGIGIPEEQKKEIFSRHFRASNAVNSSEVGSGVGLMLVRELVKLLDGEISFESKEHKGTIFTVKLKIVLSPEEQTSQKNSKYISVYEMNHNWVNPDKNKEEGDVDDGLPKLLIVEDNVDLQRFLVKSLEGKYSIKLASNGNDALEIVKKLDPDLIVSDIMMPGMDGKVLCHTLKQKIETCHIPIILLTALSSSNHRAEGYDVGADAYIEKPFDMKVLISRIENLLQIRKTLKGKFFRFDDSPNDIVYKNSLDQQFISKANEVVDREMENPDFDVEAFSEEMNVSRPVLYRKLTALTGQSPHEFMIYAKLRYAVKLLRSNQMSIKEVAYASGFSNSKYFSTTFKKYFDLTPTEFLKEKNDVLVP